MAAKIRSLTAPDQRRLDEKVLDILERAIDEKGFPHFTYISATRRRCRTVMEKLRQRRPHWKATALIPADLPHFILERAGLQEKRKVIAPGAACLLISSLLLSAAKNGELHHLSQLLKVEGPRFIYSVAERAYRFIINYRKSRRSGQTEVTDTADENMPGSAGLEHDIALILQRYNRLKSEKNLLDEADLWTVSENILNTMRTKFCAGPSCLMVDGLAVLKPLEEEVLFLLMQQPCWLDVYLTVPPSLAAHFDSGGSWGNLPPAARYYLPLKRIFHAIQTEQERREDITKLGTRLPAGEHLYIKDKPAAVKVINGGKLTLTKCNSRDEEITLIARKIKERIINGTAQLTDFHIVVPRIDRYHSLFTEIFPEYGIPFNITKGLPVTSLPVTHLVMKLLQIAQEFKRSDIYIFFSSPLINPAVIQKKNLSFSGITDLLLAGYREAKLPERLKELLQKGDFIFPEHLDIGSLDRIARVANISGGSDIFRDWLMPVVLYFEALISEAEEEDQDRVARLENELKKAISNIGLLAMELKKIKEALQARENLSFSENIKLLASGLRKLIIDYGIPYRLARSAEDLTSPPEKDLRIIVKRDASALNIILKTIDRIISDVEMVAEARSFPHWRKGTENGEGELIGFLEQLINIYLERESIWEARELEGITITETLETRNLDFRIVFFCGATSEDFPLRRHDDHLWGSRVPEVIDPTDEARMVFSHLLRNSDELHITYPQADGEEALAPSFVVQDLQQLMGGNSKNNKEISAPQKEIYLSASEVFEGLLEETTKLSSIDLSRIMDLASAPDFEKPYILKDGLPRFREKAAFSLSRYILMEPAGFYGILDDKEISFQRGTKAKKFLISASRNLSTTALDEFASCPQKFFFHRILGLEPLEDVREEIEKTRLGVLVHKILAKFYTEWTKKKKNITPQNIEEATSDMLDIAISILRKEAEKRNLIIKHQVESIISGLDPTEKDRKMGILRGLLENEAKARTNFLPVLFEYSFGKGGNSPLTIKSPEGREISISGRMDRVDVELSEDTGTPETLLILDYKTGKSYPGYTQMKEGRSFQMPVYLMKAREMEQFRHIKSFGSAYYGIKYKEPPKLHIGILLEPSQESEQKTTFGRSRGFEKYPEKPFFTFITNLIFKISHMIERGFFHPTLDIKNCKWCNFKTICFANPSLLAQIWDGSEFYNYQHNLSEFEKMVTPENNL